MAYRDLREWIDRLEAEGELKRIKAKVDWNLELAGISKKVFAERGPALLFENIKDYEHTPSRRLFTGGLATRGRIAMMLGLPKDASYREQVKLLRQRMKEAIKPVTVTMGPVKENIIKGSEVDLFQFPVPLWHALDGGRYIITYGGVVTRDPESGDYNAGLYRGMITSKNEIGVWLITTQHWGIHYSKYQSLGQPMPVAVVIGHEPGWAFAASCPISHTTGSEYDLLGAIRQQPVEVIKCETSDLEVPAFAEIVIEGTISPDPRSYQMEGPFGEYTGYYGAPGMRPVIKVDCITHRNHAIFRGQLEGQAPGVVNENAVTAYVINSAFLWDVLESQHIPGVIDLIPAPWTIVKIRKMYEGQARQVAAAIWGSKMARFCRVVVVVEEDVDIYNLRAVQQAILSKADFKNDVIVYPMNLGGMIDPSLPLEVKDELKYRFIGGQDRLLIDATTDWETYPIREEWGGERFPRRCTELTPEIEKLVEDRWHEYGF